jgi:hypothetical protein
VLENHAQPTHQNGFWDGILETVSKVLFKITEVFGAAFFQKAAKAAFFVKRAPKNSL